MDKLERISAAAILLFGRDGYEATTLRDIANEADVALGTLSLYARDKRDLVFMIFNRVIPPLMERGRRNTDPTAPLVDNMVAFFEPFYTAYADDVTLYRVVLGQVYNGAPTKHSFENDAIRLDLLRHLADIVLRAIAARLCRADADAQLQARSFFYLYFAAVRVWLLQDDPDPRSGIEELRSLYLHHVAGLLPAE